MLQARGLTKRYGGLLALDRVSFELHPGEIVGYLGPNGSTLLRLFQLHDSRYRTMNAYSKGMRQRVLLAAALLHNPDLLVLDEPFSGLDVNAGLLFRALLRQLAAQGKMVFFSTHRFDMVEKLCSRVVILSAGRLVAERALTGLDQPGGDTLEDLFVGVTDPPDFEPVAQQILETIGGS